MLIAEQRVAEALKLLRAKDKQLAKGSLKGGLPLDEERRLPACSMHTCCACYLPAAQFSQLSVYR